MAKRIDISIALSLIVIAGIMIFVSQGFPKAQGHDVGAGYFPVLLSCLLIFLSFCLIFNSLKNSKPVQEQSVKADIKKVILGMGSTTLYFVILIYLGFIIATPIFLAGMMWMYNYRKKLQVVIWSVVLTAFIYVCFDVLLQVPIPMGILAP